MPVFQSMKQRLRAVVATMSYTPSLWSFLASLANFQLHSTTPLFLWKARTFKEKYALLLRFTMRDCNKNCNIIWHNWRSKAEWNMTVLMWYYHTTLANKARFALLLALSGWTLLCKGHFAPMDLTHTLVPAPKAPGLYPCYYVQFYYFLHFTRVAHAIDIYTTGYSRVVSALAYL